MTWEGAHTLLDADVFLFSTLLSLTNGTSISVFHRSSKVSDFAAPGAPLIRERGRGWWWMFESISLLLRTSGGALGDCSLWKAVTHNLNDYSSRRDKDSWLCAVSCWGLLSEDRWVEANIYKNGEWNKNIQVWPYVAA